ncbi:MAG: hypothetical protein BGO57_10230 [Sphingomonadales bacterium 63-6]|nr:MAG: hypothetical protein BGO57_10230 [Sphingomonadales bacterium 63-6]
MKFQMLGVVALSIVGVAGTANAADLTPTEIVNRHVSSGGNVDAIMADYADDAVVLQQGRAFQGKEAIRGLFENMFKRPAGAPAPSAPPPGAGNGGPPKMNVTKVWEEGDVGFMTWEMGPMKATEEFIVRGGKIQVQTIFMSGPPAGGPTSH